MPDQHPTIHTLVPYGRTGIIYSTTPVAKAETERMLVTYITTGNTESRCRSELVGPAVKITNAGLVASDQRLNITALVRTLGPARAK